MRRRVRVPSASARRSAIEYSSGSEIRCGASSTELARDEPHPEGQASTKAAISERSVR